MRAFLNKPFISSLERACYRKEWQIQLDMLILSLMEDQMVKLCIPITGSDREEIKSQLNELALLDFEMIEWRADYHFSMEVLKEISEAFPDKELIFTYRTKVEGGETQPEDEFLSFVYTLVALSGMVHIIDLELEGICKTSPDIIKRLKPSGVKLMISNHDFEKTPSEKEITDRFKKMETLGADIAKIAVMPGRIKDVEILISAAKTANKLLGIPIVAISMGELGKKTRIEGEEFGSIITFGSLDKKSAPGQIPAKELMEMLKAQYQQSRMGLS